MQAKDRVEERNTGKAAEARRSNGGLMLSAEQLDAMLGEARRSVEGAQNIRGKSTPTLEIERLAKVIAGSGAARQGDMTLSLDALTQMLREAQSETPRAPSSRPDAAPREGPRIRQLSDARLDVNLLANLARWVGFHKRTLGTQIMRALVETYAMTGHLTPKAASVLVHAEAFTFLPDESRHNEVSDDNLSLALQSLHGIIYGTGVLPPEPPDPLALARALKWTVREEEAEDEETAASDEAGPERAAARARPKLPRDYERALSALRKAFAKPASDEGPAIAPDPEAESGAVQAEAGEAQTATEKPSHPTNLTDDEWERIRPMVPVTKTGGRPGKYDKREIVNAIIFHVKTGCPWRGLPSDLPPWKIAHHYYRSWTAEGVWDPINKTLGLTAAATESRSERPAGAASEHPVKAHTS